ncbi:unnamed protein product [Amoebophrya sp. A120]|nr:unnamed protein product [Amoebophrya sp. A120]|eukprot:GSA120T00011375001.1
MGAVRKKTQEEENTSAATEQHDSEDTEDVEATIKRVEQSQPRRGSFIVHVEETASETEHDEVAADNGEQQLSHDSEDQEQESSPNEAVVVTNEPELDPENGRENIKPATRTSFVVQVESDAESNLFAEENAAEEEEERARAGKEDDLAGIVTIPVDSDEEKERELLHREKERKAAAAATRKSQMQKVKEKQNRKSAAAPPLEGMTAAPKLESFQGTIDLSIPTADTLQQQGLANSVLTTDSFASREKRMQDSGKVMPAKQVGALFAASPFAEDRGSRLLAPKENDPFGLERLTDKLDPVGAPPLFSQPSLLGTSNPLADRGPSLWSGDSTAVVEDPMRGASAAPFPSASVARTDSTVDRETILSRAGGPTGQLPWGQSGVEQEISLLGGNAASLLPELKLEQTIEQVTGSRRKEKSSKSNKKDRSKGASDELNELDFDEFERQQFLLIEEEQRREALQLEREEKLQWERIEQQFGEQSQRMSEAFREEDERITQTIQSQAAQMRTEFKEELKQEDVVLRRDVRQALTVLDRRDEVAALQQQVAEMRVKQDQLSKGTTGVSRELSPENVRKALDSVKEGVQDGLNSMQKHVANRTEWIATELQQAKQERESLLQQVHDLHAAELQRVGDRHQTSLGQMSGFLKKNLDANADRFERLEDTMRQVGTKLGELESHSRNQYAPLQKSLAGTVKRDELVPYLDSRLRNVKSEAKQDADQQMSEIKNEVAIKIASLKQNEMLPYVESKMATVRAETRNETREFLAEVKTDLDEKLSHAISHRELTPMLDNRLEALQSRFRSETQSLLHNVDLKVDNRLTDTVSRAELIPFLETRFGNEQDKMFKTVESVQNKIVQSVQNRLTETEQGVLNWGLSIEEKLRNFQDKEVAPYQKHMTAMGQKLDAKYADLDEYVSQLQHRVNRIDDIERQVQNCQQLLDNCLNAVLPELGSKIEFRLASTEQNLQSLNNQTWQEERNLANAIQNVSNDVSQLAQRTTLIAESNRQAGPTAVPAVGQSGIMYYDPAGAPPETFVYNNQGYSSAAPLPPTQQGRGHQGQEQRGPTPVPAFGDSGIFYDDINLQYAAQAGLSEKQQAQVAQQLAQQVNLRQGGAAATVRSPPQTPGFEPFPQMLGQYQQQGLHQVQEQQGVLYTDLSAATTAPNLLVRAPNGDSTRKRLKKIMGLLSDDLPPERLAVEELKELGNAMFLKRDYETAGEYFSKAIAVVESRFYENCPRDATSKQVLAVLYGNRCQCYLMLAKQAQKGLPFDPYCVSVDVRFFALRANRDAAVAHGLDSTNGKHFHRRGQALLLLSSLSQRTQLAGKCFKKALALGNLPKQVERETRQWLQYAEQRFVDEKEMPLVLAHQKVVRITDEEDQNYDLSVRQTQQQLDRDDAQTAQQLQLHSVATRSGFIPGAAQRKKSSMSVRPSGQKVKLSPDERNLSPASDEVRMIESDGIVSEQAKVVEQQHGARGPSARKTGSVRGSVTHFSPLASQRAPTASRLTDMDRVTKQSHPIRGSVNFKASGADPPNSHEGNYGRGNSVVAGGQVQFGSVRVVDQYEYPPARASSVREPIPSDENSNGFLKVKSREISDSVKRTVHNGIDEIENMRESSFSGAGENNENPNSSTNQLKVKKNSMIRRSTTGSGQIEYPGMNVLLPGNQTGSIEETAYVQTAGTSTSMRGSRNSALNLGGIEELQGHMSLANVEQHQGVLADVEDGLRSPEMSNESNGSVVLQPDSDDFADDFEEYNLAPERSGGNSEQVEAAERSTGGSISRRSRVEEGSHSSVPVEGLPQILDSNSGSSTERQRSINRDARNTVAPRYSRTNELAADHSRARHLETRQLQVQERSLGHTLTHPVNLRLW